MSIQAAEGGLAGQLATPTRRPMLSSKQKYVWNRVLEYMALHPNAGWREACTELKLDAATYMLADRIIERLGGGEPLPVADDEEAFSEAGFHTSVAPGPKPEAAVVEAPGIELTTGERLAVDAVAAYEREHPGCTRTQALKDTKSSVATFYSAQARLRGDKVPMRQRRARARAEAADKTLIGGQPQQASPPLGVKRPDTSGLQTVPVELAGEDELIAMASVMKVVRPLPPAVRGRVLGAVAVLTGAIDPWREPA